ncbi:MAG: hypothetical protein J3Q66DRAFT_172124 [Benniella sp.]|nr:MAG: hypothetical protein J3Q66DRAFT_172124 [Benniella sp.]
MMMFLQKECDVLWLYGPLYQIDFVKQQQRLYPSEGACLSEPERVHVQSPLQSPQNQPEANLAQQTSMTDEATATTALAATTASTTTAAVAAATTTTAEASTTAVVATEALAESSIDADAATEASTPAVDTSAAAAQTVAKSSSAQPSAADSTCTGILRPTKSALKRRTRAQVFDELRAFTHSSNYEVLSRVLALSADYLEGSTASALNHHSEGSRSEPISPTSNGASSLLIPIFPAPTKYHFRSHDRRRASFPKSASQPNRLNMNVNLSVNMQMTCCDNGGSSSTGAVVSGKQLRFSLEVQELLFLPTSPPFRISRAKPTRAHSDPAIQSTACSSFIAPSASSLASHMHHHPSGSMITTAAAATGSSSSEETTTTFIKVQAHDSSRVGSGKRSSMWQGLDDVGFEYNVHDDFNDDSHFEDCREVSDYDDEDEEDDEYNGVGTGSHRYKLSTKNAIVARRAQADEHRKAAPGMLWQVYTAVTGVKELIAWYGSMVYHSSSL